MKGLYVVVVQAGRVHIQYDPDGGLTQDAPKRLAAFESARRAIAFAAWAEARTRGNACI